MCDRWRCKDGGSGFLFWRIYVGVLAVGRLGFLLFTGLRCSDRFDRCGLHSILIL